ARLSLLALGHRNKLDKLQGLDGVEENIELIMSLRLAALFYRNRDDVELPAMHGQFVGAKFYLTLQSGWLAQNPLTEMALQEEARQWKALGVSMQVQEG
ncbi:MAG: exopolyphosphatase, partial [Gallionellaceae bacterium]|nr:exopolyphosphatase [Gallionellaceae bacterium]